MKIKASWVLAGILLASALVTMIFWRQVTFSRRLGDDALETSLADGSTVRDAQHGLEEITRRFGEQAPGMDRWAARAVAASRRPEAPVRRAAAWAMQSAWTAQSRGDPAAGRDDFRARLREMLADPDEAARRNASCSLAWAGGKEGLPVLRSMLANHVVRAAAAGTVESVLAQGRLAVQDGRVARLRGEGGSVEVSAPVPGRVVAVLAAEGSVVKAGDPVLELAPDPLHVRNAALALACVGTPADALLLDALAGPSSPLPEADRAHVREAAAWLRRQ
ncbi:MAG: hypothetical protein HMLKMBBP_01433 [Planctomycetes bacterium]|nr:hypothetical protein [Planctomycetota bacterium]